MNALDWLREASRQPLVPVYAVFGDDAYLVRESIHAVTQAVFPGSDADATISRFAGPATDLAAVLDELFTLPFFSRRRLVIIEEADPFVSKHRKDLEAYVERPSASGVLLIQPKQWPATTKLARLVDQSGLAVDCGALRDRDTPKVVTWLIEYASRHCDAHLDSGAARLLVDLVGLELGILVAEVEKLAVYAGESRRISRGDVAKLVEAGRVETIWKALDAATTGQGATALKLLDELLAAGAFPTPLLAAISASLLKIHHAGRLRAARLSLDEACRIAGIPTWAVEKTGKQHAHLGPRRVDRLPELLLRADLDLKGGSALDPRVILERLMIELALPRTD
ncbi:MAG TPA: DNA polymerase III subunit delta [Isosphaeraceae bacterium]|nr:DNA polymerase III subunit delta [Isosphaeraceae bacterium]